MNRCRLTWLRKWGAQPAQLRPHKNAMVARARRIAVKLHKVVITAIARKLVTIVNTLVKSGQNWSVQAF